MCDPPCDNGACIANDTCKCAEGYTGKTCSEIGRSQIVDLIFVLLDSYMYTPTYAVTDQCHVCGTALRYHCNFNSILCSIILFYMCLRV